MTTLQFTIPAQDKASSSVKLKPREIREWLDDLPFMNLERTAEAASEQLRLLNRYPMSVTARLEITGRFLGCYQRLIEAVAVSRGDMECTKSLILRLCQETGFSYKIALNELANEHNPLLGRRNLQTALLGTLYALGEQLRHYYATYQRAPRSLWNECASIYFYAYEAGYENYHTAIPGAGDIQISECFHLIALLHHADPYHLPAGALEPLTKYFKKNATRCMIEHTADDHGEEHANWLPIWPTDGRKPEIRTYLNIDELLDQMATTVITVKHTKTRAKRRRSNTADTTVLIQTLKKILGEWRQHPSRKSRRQAAIIRLELVAGITATHCVLNNGHCFDPDRYTDTEKQEEIHIGQQSKNHSTCRQKQAEPFLCSSINRSNSGLAVEYREKRQPHPKVGQLVAIRRLEAKSGGWVLAACRWLIKASPQGFDLGLQYLARNPKAIVIHITDHIGTSSYHPAASALQKRGDQQIQTVICQPGLLQPGQRVEIIEKNRKWPIECQELLESEIGFERYIYTLGKL